MKTTLKLIAALVLLSVLNPQLSRLFAQSSAFTYQGRLTDNGLPANGTYDMQFGLCSAAGGATVLALVTNRPIEVSNGLFATVLDFGPGAFDGSPRWLELGVRTNGSATPYFLLSPRQFISFIPYSITAVNLAGTVPGGGLAGAYTNAVALENAANSFAGNGAGLTGLNAGNLEGGTINDARLSPNVALLNAHQTFSGANTLSNAANTFAGNGAELTALNAGNVASGTLADARLSANVPLLNAANTFTNTNVLTGLTIATNPNNVFLGTFTGPLLGNVLGAASTATNFTGLLNGDVTGPQGATVVATVGGQNAANVASGAAAANAATAANTPGTLVKRDASGNIAAGAVNAAALSGDGAGVTNLNASSMAAGTLADVRLSSNVPLRNGTNTFAGDNTFTGIVTATNANNTLSGAFTGNLTGNVQGNVVGAASTATNFTGLLNGDVTGPQGATVVASVGGQSAENLASGAAAANAAAAANTPGTIAKRDGSGNFAAGSVIATSFSGDGSNVTNLNALSVASGTLADARLSGNVPLLNGNQSYTGVNTFGNSGNSFSGSFAGDGAGVTNLNGGNLVSGTVGSAQLGASAVQAANIAAGAVGTTQIAAGAVGNTQLASGAAVANLQASGQSGVGLGGVILSTNPVSSTLIAAGYMKIGMTAVGDIWEQRASGSPLAGRVYHTAIWTGGEMIVWGGATNVTAWPYGYLGDGGRYNSTANSWTATATNNAPSARSAHTAIWTGTEMIIWGGNSTAGAVVSGTFTIFKDGKRYNPLTDTWADLATTGAPHERTWHSAVWTGTDMIVWGGYDTTNFFRTGARYKAADDTWTAISTNGAPTPRYWHTAVWTGNEMIVWGGYNGSTDVNDGGRYNPRTDTWTSIAISGSPSAREGHTAVWTGSRMSVWGGRFSGSIFNDGAAYDPVSDTWTAVTSSGAPPARYGHTALWTGNKMIVWGGANSGADLKDGGIYSPMNGSWSPAATSAAPSARIYHKAIWTGTEMIVWGGFNHFSNTYFDDTPTYQPSTTMYLYLKP